MKNRLGRFRQDTPFWEMVDRTNECWTWLAGTDRHGYGKCRRHGQHLAHRVAWVITHGEIPDHLDIDHLCRNRKCVNPSHMELVTRAVNSQRRGPTCKRGHEFTERNTYLFRGWRVCRACKAQRERNKRVASAIGVI